MEQLVRSRTGKPCRFCDAVFSRRWNWSECWDCQKKRVAEWKRERRATDPSYRAKENTKSVAARKIKYATDEAFREDVKARASRHYAEHRDEILERNRQRYRDDPEYRAKTLAQATAWRAANPQRKSETARAYRLRMGEALLTKKRAAYHADVEANRARSRAYKAANLESVRAMNRRYMEANRDVYRHNSRVRKARVRAAEGTYTLAQWREICEKYGNLCIDCGLPEKLTVGHARPLCRGGSNWPENIIPQCLACNLKQGTKIHPSALAREGVAA